MTCIHPSHFVPPLKTLAESYISIKNGHLDALLREKCRLQKGKPGEDLGWTVGCKSEDCNRGADDLFKEQKSISNEEEVDTIYDRWQSLHGEAGSSVQCKDQSVLLRMKHEHNRLESYKDKWPLQFIKPAELAASGFFYLGTSDLVQCAFCGAVLKNWKAGDHPVKEHMLYSPMCLFLLGRDVGNIPLPGSNLIENLWITESHPECSHSSDDVASDTVPFFPRAVARYPEFKNVDRRLQSYTNWSSLSVCGPEELAECGLFYTGESDHVTCFYCGGTLGHWERGDDPWTEHAKHFPSCAYVKFVKGSSFIDSVRNGGRQPEGASSAANNYVPPSICARYEKLTNQEEKVAAVSTSTKCEPQSHNVCKICIDEKPRVAFIPCGHVYACVDCSKHLSSCPVCRQNISSTVRVYID